LKIPFEPKSHPSWNSALLRACRRESTSFTPVWLLRQAGRYMPEYRELREKVSLLELCRTPDLVAQVTAHAAERLGVDAAILFSDLLLVAEPLGFMLEYNAGDGPAISPALDTGADVDRVCAVEPGALSYVFEGARATRARLPDHLPLIGFAGAPFTIASYLIEGGPTRSFEKTKRFLYADGGAWRALMAKLVPALIDLLNGQIRHGCSVVQIFDSWVGCLSPHDYRRYVKPYTAAVIAGLVPYVPVIHFGTGTSALLHDMREAGGDVIGLDWRVDLDEAWGRVGYDRPVMGNLDPVVLFAPEDILREQTRRILQRAAGRPGHIFNLGHGILPETPVDSVSRLVQLVHEMSRRP
jgi:uroporphyrinogen decarboxylase